MPSRILPAVMWLLASVAQAASLEGQVTLTLEGKALRADQAREAVVYFRPAVPRPPPAAAEALVVRMERKQFVPRVLPVTVGSAIRFENFDPILHNAFSPAGANGFDVGLYGRGEGREHRFEHPGLVRIYCNVHHDMVAHVLVLDTAAFAAPDAAGQFRLEVDGPLQGELFVWHERARLWRMKLEGPPAGRIEVSLDLSRPRVPPHMNKFGKPYGGQRSGY